MYFYSSLAWSIYHSGASVAASHGTNIFIVVGGGLGAGVLVILLIVVMCLMIIIVCMRRRRNGKLAKVYMQLLVLE